MSKKNRKKRQANAPQSERAERYMAKGNAKAALKEAKRCYRVDPSVEHRELLEKALLGRVQQLHGMKMIADAKSVLSELLELNPRSPQVTSSIERLQVIVGHEGTDAEAILKSDPVLLVELVDQAVLDERCVIPNCGDVGPQVMAVREALAAVERGDDDSAAEQLKTVARNSPLADWRLFVRGLSAFYQQDQSRTEKNWERLDPVRPGYRIAQTLRAAVGTTSPEEQSDAVSRGLRILTRHARSDPAFDTLKQLADAWKQGDWRRFFRVYRQLRQRFAESHEALIRQIVDLIWRRAVREGDGHMLSQLARFGPAPVMDPNWNRAKAMLGEHSESDDEIIDVETNWVAYARDTRQLASLREEERLMAEGLVYQRLGRFFCVLVERVDGHLPYLPRAQEERDRLVETAAHYYRKSITACPRLQASYVELAGLHEENEQSNRAARVMEKLARHDPDCFDAAIWLASYYLAEDEPGKSERHIEAARRLRPRDSCVSTLAWNQKVTMARCLAINRQFEAARQELDQAAQLATPDVDSYTLDLLRAGVEFKAKNVDVANTHVNAALAKVDEPTPIWLQMSATVVRMRVAREFKKDFSDRFKADIEKRPKTATAGRMAGFLLGMKLSKANYSGRATHERLLIKYLRRALAIKWDGPDLLAVCQFLREFPRERPLASKFSQAGQDHFPQIPHFPLWNGLYEVGLGPFNCDRSGVLEDLQKAIDLHEQGGIKLSDSELEQARSAISMVKDYQEPTAGYRSGSPCYSDDEYEDDEYEDDEYEDDEHGDDAGFRMPMGGAEDDALAALLAAMPPDVRSTLMAMADEMGIPLEEALRITVEAAGRLAFSESQPSRPGRE